MKNNNNQQKINEKGIIDAEKAFKVENLYDLIVTYQMQLNATGLNDAETDGPGKATPRENLKVKFCKDMLQLQSQYNLAPGGEQRDIRAYELATRFYQASCYGDCWFLTHYAKSVNDSAPLKITNAFSMTTQSIAHDYPLYNSSLMTLIQKSEERIDAGHGPQTKA